MALNDEEALVRGHAASALGRIALRADANPGLAASVGAMLVGRLAVEMDEWVREEIGEALAS